MKKLALREIQLLQLDILLAFDAFCTEHDLRYQLSYGTLIGAVRHQGFIPWDDDVDVTMPQEDYFRFLELIDAQDNGGMMTERYRVADVSIRSEFDYHQTFAKIYDTNTVLTQTSLRSDLNVQECIFIDVFCLSGMPESIEDERALIEEIRLINDMNYYACAKLERSDLPLRQPGEALRILNSFRQARKHEPACWQRRYSAMLRTLPSPDGATRAYDVKNYLMDGDSCKFESNPWQPTTRMEFEGHMFCVPERYDEVLSHIYGNYLSLPPEDARKPSHDQGAYLKEEI